MVLCPSSARFHWRDELRRWLPSHLAHVASSCSSSTADPSSAASSRDPIHLPTSATAAYLPEGVLCYILSYDLAVRLASPLAALAPRVIVADESQYLKSPTAQRTKVRK